MTWFWPYLLGLLTLPALTLLFAIVISIRRSMADPQARQGWKALAFLTALTAVAFLLGLNMAVWREAWGW